jgi:hypothetical protein
MYIDLHYSSVNLDSTEQLEQLREAMVKLAWLLANYKDLAEVKRLFGKNLVGEISEFSRIDHEA